MSNPLILIWMWVGIISATLFALGFVIWLGGLIAAWVMPPKSQTVAGGPTSGPAE